MGTERARAAIKVPREAVGFIIGRHGETVRSLSTRSGAFIAVDETPAPGDATDQPPNTSSTGVFNITGTPAQIERARSLISEKVNAILLQPPKDVVRDAIILSPTTDTSAPSTPFGKTNGDNGESVSSEHKPANVASRAGNGHTRPLPTSPEMASANVTAVSVYAPIRLPLEMWIPSQKVGMIIGQKGQVISTIEGKSGATIVVHNQNKGVDGSKLLTISGEERNRKVAKDLIEEVLSRDVRSGPSMLRRSANRSAGPSSRPRHVDRSDAPYAQLVTTPSPSAPPSTSFVETMSSSPQDSDQQQQPPPQPPGVHPGYYAPTPVPYGQVPYVQPRIQQSPAAGASPTPVMHVKPVCVPTSCVGIVIGKGGETIQDLQSRSGAYIKVTPDREANANDKERNIFITGPPEAVDLAHNLLNDIVNEGLRRSYRDGVEPGGVYGSGSGGGNGEREPSVESGSGEGSTATTTQGSGEGTSTTTTQTNIPQLSIDGEYRLVQQPATRYPSTSISIELNIPNAKVGVIIGKGGQAIRELQQKSGARIVISKKMDMTKEDNPRMVTITGPPRFVEIAHALIQAKIRGDPVVSGESVVGTPPTQRLPPSPITVPPDAIQVPIPAMMAAPRFPSRMAYFPTGPQPGGPPDAGSQFQPPNMAEIQAMRNRMAVQHHHAAALQHQMQLQQQAFHHQQAAAALHMHHHHQQQQQQHQQQPIFQPYPQQQAAPPPPPPPQIMFAPPYGPPAPAPFRVPDFGRGVIGEEIEGYRTEAGEQMRSNVVGENVDSLAAGVRAMHIAPQPGPAHHFSTMYHPAFNPQAAAAAAPGFPSFGAFVPQHQMIAPSQQQQQQQQQPNRSLPESSSSGGDGVAP